MHQKFALAIVLVLLCCPLVNAQFYPVQHRPSIDWQQLTTPHFKIIYPQGEDSAAWKTARILEREYPEVQELTGGALSGFPVILTNYNDRSNGLVTTLHFRSEIDIPPIKGKALNPETGGWLENVVPHELVHALQFSHLGGVGLGQLVNIFSPDLARSMHGATPSGIREGLATYYESESVTPGGGRGNYPFFYNQFNAVFTSSQRWSMGQMIHFPVNTRPFNRHYIGGYEFTQWLQEVYGKDTSRDAIEFNIRWPFLGYGVALKHATGQWPAQLYNAFEKDKQKTLADSKKSFTAKINILSIPFNGREVRRPKWLNDSTLIFHGSFYNAEAGFHQYDLHNDKIKRLLTTQSIRDFDYALSNDKTSLIYSYYDPDVIYPNAFKATLMKASLTNGSQQMVIPERRIFAPTFASDTLLIALETHHTHSKLVELNLTNYSVNTLFSEQGYQLVSVAVNPQNPDSLAVIMNKDGNQALWLASKNELEKDLLEPPRVAFSDGSVFDPVWHPEGNRLLFSADFSEALQVYEFDLRTGNITQLTHSPYNAFEPSYSPDGSRIAFVVQWKNEQMPAVLARKDFSEKEISLPSQPVTIPKHANTSAKESAWTQKNYSTGFSWLKPRTALPAIEEVPGSNGDIYQVGIGLHSSDLLQQQSYSLETTYTEERLWYDLSYQNKRFFPGFRAQIFSEPAFQQFRFESDGEQFIQEFLQQERSFALSVPMQFTFEQNVAFTGLFVEPEVRQSRFRFFNLNGDNVSDFANATIGNVFAQVNYKLQQNIRDVQPHSGLAIYSELEHFFHAEGLTLASSQGDAVLNLIERTGLRGGIFSYVSPLKRWNQSLRLGLEAITETGPVFNNQSIVSEGFSESIFPVANNVLSLSSRYTIPLAYPDNGGLLLPLYLSSIYLAGFSNSVVDPTSDNWISDSRTVVGGGLRVQFRISNLTIDIGAGIGFEPSRNEIHYFIGDF